MTAQVRTGSGPLPRMLWRQADGMLSGYGSPRFTLMLAGILNILLALAGETVLSCLYLALDMLEIPSPPFPWQWAVWLVPAVLVVLPLAAAVYRLAVLLVLERTDMTSHSGKDAVPEGVTGMAVRLTACLYPFTSLRAYVTCLTVGLEAAGWGALAAVPAAVLVSKAQGALLRSGAVLLSLAYILFILWLSGLRAGYAGTVFARERLACGWRRRCSLRTVFCLRMRMLGCCLVCALGVLVPLLLYAAPKCLLCGALYAVGTVDSTDVIPNEKGSRGAGEGEVTL